MLPALPEDSIAPGGRSSLLTGVVVIAEEIILVGRMEIDITFVVVGEGSALFFLFLKIKFKNKKILKPLFLESYVKSVPSADRSAGLE